MLITLACAPAAAADGPGSPEQAVRRAWEAARDAGAYRFASDVVQTTRPAPALSNVGRSITRNELHLEGNVDLPARSLEMRLWTNGGSVANPASASEMRIEGEQAWTRQPGGSWQQVEDFTGGFAPNGDFLSYLAGIKNVRETGSEGASFHFDFDGPAFANYMRDQLEQYLRERGELPAGLYLDSSRTYQEMTGQGEITLAEVARSETGHSGLEGGLERPAAAPERASRLSVRREQSARRGGYRNLLRFRLRPSWLRRRRKRRQVQRREGCSER